MQIKILYISSIDQKTDYNPWFSFNLLETVNTLFGVEVKFYGKGIHQYYPALTIQEYSDDITLESLYDKYPFNVIIFGNINRLNNRCIGSDKSQHILDIPKDYLQYRGLKIALEGDFHYSTLKTSRLYKTYSHVPSINLMLHRHKTTYELAVNKLPFIKHLWFPCSVNEKIFFPQNKERLDKIAFIGHYKRDGFALNLLKQAGFLGFMGKKYGLEYLNGLQEYTMYFNHSGPFNIDNAKSFEIIASGGILITNECDNGFSELFGQESYITYQNPTEDLILKIAEIYKNPQLQKSYIQKGLNSIYQKHTHKIRAQELINIIKKELYENTQSSPIFDSVDSVDTTDETSNLKTYINTEIARFGEKENPTELDKLALLNNLLKIGARVCLLEQTCFDVVISNALSNQLCIGLNPMINSLSNKNIIIKRIPEKTKIHHLKGLALEVPLPVIQYLIRLYGATAKDALKRKGYHA